MSDLAYASPQPRQLPMSQQARAGMAVPADLKPWTDRRENAAQDRRRYEPTWHLCQAFVANRQWVGWSKRDRRIVNEPNPQDRERHTVNVLTQYLMTNVGKLVSDDLAPHLYARNTSVESEDFVKQANVAVEYALDEEVDSDSKLYDILLKMCAFGTAAGQCHWDAGRGPLIASNVPYGPDGKPMLNMPQAYGQVANGVMQGAPPTQFRDVRGRICWTVLSPFNILVPPGVEHDFDFPWIIVERPVPLDQVQAVYGDAAAGLQAQDLSSVDLLGYRDLSSDAEPAGASPGKLKDHVLLATGYEMPTRQFQQGREVTWSQRVKLEEKPQLPYLVNGERKAGIVFFHYNRVPGRFWGIGCIEPGIGPQRQRNRSRSQYIELKDRAGLGRVYARPGSLNVTKIPGGKVMEIIEVRQGYDFPQETTGLGPGPWMAEDIAMHDADLDKVMGMREVSLGGAPAGVSAYSAMALLAEQDDRRIGPILKQVRTQVGWLVKFTIESMRTYWPSDKQIMLAGQDDEIKAFMFNSAKLPTDYLVKIGKGAPAPRNQAAEIQKIFDLYDRSISGGQPLPITWLWDSLEAGQAMPLPVDVFTIQREKAEIENLFMARGGVVQPSPADDHQVHIVEHNAAIAAHQLIPGSEQMIQLIAQHVAAHEMMRAQTASVAASAPQLQGAQGALGGQTPGGPTPATPGAPPNPQDVAFTNRMSPMPPGVNAGS